MKHFFIGVVFATGVAIANPHIGIFDVQWWIAILVINAASMFQRIADREVADV
jgi:hypothetical protein